MPDFIPIVLGAAALGGLGLGVGFGAGKRVSQLLLLAGGAYTVYALTKK